MVNVKRLEMATGGTAWLVDPERFQPCVRRALTMPCPTARAVAKERKRRLEWARATPARALDGGGITFRAEEEAAASGTKSVRAVKGRVATIPVYGPLGHRLTPEVLKAGGSSMEDIGAALDACLADSSIGSIILDCDSPGGTFAGTPELADKVYNARQQKKIYSIANPMACSACYWVASAAEQMMITPSGDAASVGVYLLHVDQSAADEEEGVRVEFIYAGRHKVSGNPHQPLDAETRGFLQDQVDDDYARFVAAVARNRATTPEDVRKNYGEGRVMRASQCVAAKVCDRLMTLEELQARLAGGGGTGGGRMSSLEMKRLRHENEKAKSSFRYGAG